MSKLTKSQRQQLKDIVLQAEIQNLTERETALLVKEKMGGLDISLAYISMLKAAIRKESFSWIQKMKNTKDEYRKHRCYGNRFLQM
jgi:hypothetical protein